MKLYFILFVHLNFLAASNICHKYPKYMCHKKVRSWVRSICHKYAKNISQIRQIYIGHKKGAISVGGRVARKRTSQWTQSLWVGAQPIIQIFVYYFIFYQKIIQIFVSDFPEFHILPKKNHLPIFTQSLWVLTFSIYRISHIHFLEYPCFFVCNGSREPRVVS